MESNNNLCCLTYSIVFFSISIFSLAITYIVFAIIGLVNTSLDKQYNLCSESHLWIYSLLSLILIILKSKNTVTVFTQKYIDKNNIQFIIELLIIVGIIIWGAYELFGVNCINELNYTILYKTSFIYWIVNVFKLVLLLIFITSGLIIVKNNENNINTTNHTFNNIETNNNLV